MEKIRLYIYKLLRRSDVYAGTDMVYLAKGGFWLTVGQVFYSCSSFLLAIAFAHLLSKDSYGYYKYILSIAGIISAISLTGLDPSIIRSVSRGHDGVLKQSFWLNLRWSIGMVVISLFGALYYFYNDNYLLGVSLLIIGSFSPILNSSSLYSSFLNGKKDYKRNTLFNITRNIIPAVAIFITIVLTDSVGILVLVYFLSNTAINLYLYKRTIKIYRPSERTDSSFLTYTKHVSFINILGTIGGNLDNVLIFHFLGVVELSIYSFATSIPTQIVALLRNLNILALPKLAQRNVGEIKRSTPKKTLRLGIILLIIFICYYFAAPYIFHTFFPQYVESIAYSQALGILILINIGLIPNSFFESQMAIKEKYIMNIVSQILRLGLMIGLVIPFHIWGIIIAQLSTKIITVILSFILMSRFKDGPKNAQAQNG